MKQLLIVLVTVFIVTLVACNANSDAAAAAKPAEKTPATKEDLVKRGSYLVQISGCNDCHSPKKMGPQGPELVPELILSGYAAGTPVPKPDKATLSSGFGTFAPDLTAAAGPWGTSYAANLTPDSSSGIGSWTEQQFKTALTKGKSKGQEGGRMLLPPMPWVNYAKMNDEDIQAIFAYLQSIKSVKNNVPLPVPPGNM
ncbi:c-type cytochrome [Ferruginibacter sp.]